MYDDRLMMKLEDERGFSQIVLARVCKFVITVICKFVITVINFEKEKEKHSRQNY